MIRRLCALTVTAATVTAGAAATTAVAAPPSPGTVDHPAVAYEHLSLPTGEWARVYADGLAEVHDRTDTHTRVVQVPILDPDGATTPTGNARQLPARGELVMDLLHAGEQPYADGQVVVIYRSTGPTAQDDATLQQLGVDATTPLLTGSTRTQLAAMRTKAEQTTNRPLLDFPDGVVVHVTSTSVPSAVEKLRADPNVAYAGPNWRTTTMHTPSAPAHAPTAAARPAATAAPGVPTNYTLASSAQSLLNGPGVDAVPAYTALARHHQIPGQGQIITNVSLGDLTDAGTASDPDDPCYNYASAFGPTTVVQHGQRYIDWPSLPLIPTYTTDASGNMNPVGTTCGQDPQLVEVGLDFSMMAPLPHDRQRPGALGSGLTDLLGIAPGAQYRLVVPGTAGGLVSDVDAAFSAAATQNPRADVITASLAFGLDAQGFPSRYLEEDPVTQALITSIVHGAGIVVAVAANDGLRTATNAAVAPSGGSAATDLVTSANPRPTDINDIAFSTAPSRVEDSGAIDVGGTTLDDIFSRPPQDPANAAAQAEHAYPATRYNGGRLYSSGYGTRVNVSAPGDNVLSLAHTAPGDAHAVTVLSEGGTSASAPEVAAAAAVVKQAAELAGNRRLSTDPLAIRDFLARTGRAPGTVPQTDEPLNVGPQVDVGQAVEAVFAAAGEQQPSGVRRVAIEQRQQVSALGGSITTATDPTNVSLAGRLVNAWITITPDWAGLDTGQARYALSAANGPQGRLATTPWARLQPAAILAAAGKPLVSTQSRTVPLLYTATEGGNLVATVRFSITFGPTDGTRPSVPAPITGATVTGSTLSVRYDITNLVGATDPTLVVSHPGRVDPATGLFFRPSYTAPITAPTGTIAVPVSALQGAGVYGVGIQNAPGGNGLANDSAFAFVHVEPTGDTQPPVPLVATVATSAGHYAEPAYRGSFAVTYDLRSVAGADGAILEVSAPGPTPFHNYNTFNNPNGSERDHNGYDTGSVAYLPLGGTHGTATITAAQAHLAPTMNQVIRVLATRAGAVTGEASGVSSVSMDGVHASDYGSVANGFGVNGNGTDGLLTSYRVSAHGTAISTVQTFNQNTAEITGTVTRSTTDAYATLNGACPGIYANDVGLYVDSTATRDKYRTLNPVRTRTPGPDWTPPSAAGPVICAAQNQSTIQTAVLGGASGPNTTLRVTASNIAANRFGSPISLRPGIPAGAITVAGGIGQDTSTNQAVVPIIDAAQPNAPGRIVTADLDDGTVDSFASVTTYFASGIAVDSTTHRALVPSTDTFGTYDLTARTGVAHTVGGSIYQHPASDAPHGEFVLQEVSSPDATGVSPNNNALSSVVVVDEDGNLLQRIEAFNFFDIYLLDMGSYVQLNPATRTAFTLGPAGGQLYPFRYDAGH